MQGRDPCIENLPSPYVRTPCVAQSHCARWRRLQFLATHEGTYDVIITDSSDPVGPAASLFEKPYFQLLHDALTPGGHISTQGECLWLHLGLIQDLLKMTRGIFTTSEYAYTTIPTYPSGQIGFMVCAKAPGRDLKTPVREGQGYAILQQSPAFVGLQLARIRAQLVGRGQRYQARLRS